jgi:peptidoglycan/LPS O-acetylase OafA/YrhL
VRINRLDVLRAIAIFLVLGRHVYFTRFWMRTGWMGVDLFFVLSGFLVSGLLFSEHRRDGHMSVGRFWLRRAFKIYPPFYVLLAASLLLGFHQEGHFAAEALFVQNYIPGWWHHTWSLAVEEHFYVLLPLGLLLLQRFGRRADRFPGLPLAVLGLCTLTLALRILGAVHAPTITKQLLISTVRATHLRIDSLAFGVLIAYAFHFHRPVLAKLTRRHLVLMLIASALILAPCTLVDVDKSVVMATVGLTATYLGFGGILLAVMLWPSSEAPTGPVSSALGYVGRHSYSIYLWHLPVKMLTERAFARYFPHASDQKLFVVYSVLSIAVGVLTAKLIETPALRLRDRLIPSRRRPAEAIPAASSATAAR